MTLCSVHSPIRKNSYSGRVISIVCGWGGPLGMGHAWRMTSLLSYLNSVRGVNAFLIADSVPAWFPPGLAPCVKKSINRKSDLIIRDMRDSDTEEIVRLKKTAPVLVVDDNGPGRDRADFTIDLLPNPERDDCYRKDCFIYGYNFISSLARLGNSVIKKEIDFALYPGSDAPEEYIQFLFSILPQDARTAVLNGNESFINYKGEKRALADTEYSEIILSSRAVLSHFGITLYEGRISGCRTISLNPSQYHHALSEMAKGDIIDLNLGVKDALIKKMASEKIINFLNDAPVEEADAAAVYERAVQGLKNFYTYIKNL